jgi:hypothetical protein
VNETLPLFEVDSSAGRFHGTQVGLSRHLLAGEELCAACRGWRDELVAAGYATPLDEERRPARSVPVRTPPAATAPVPAPVPPSGERVVEELVVTSRARDAVDDAVLEWIRGLYRRYADVDDVDYENDHGLVTVSATVYRRARPGGTTGERS